MAIAKRFNCIDYVDRDQEVSLILNDIRENTCEKALVIYSKTAIGKTALTSKIKGEIEKELSNMMTAIVRTPPDNEKVNLSEWEYLNEIFNELQYCFEKSKKYNFSKFYASLKNNYVKSKSLNDLIDKLSESEPKNKSIFVLLSFWIKRIFRLGVFNESEILENNNESTRKVKQQYIRFILKRGNIILIIRDVQKIDYESLNFLTTCMSENIKMRNYFIFEYTISESNSISDMQSFATLLKDTGIDVGTSLLTKLSKNFALDIIAKHFDAIPEAMDFSIDAVNYYDTEAKGNIRQLLDFVMVYENIHEPQYSYDATFMNIKELSKSVSKIF